MWSVKKSSKFGKLGFVSVSILCSKSFCVDYFRESAWHKIFLTLNISVVVVFFLSLISFWEFSSFFIIKLQQMLSSLFSLFSFLLLFTLSLLFNLTNCMWFLGEASWPFAHSFAVEIVIKLLAQFLLGAWHDQCTFVCKLLAFSNFSRCMIW